jgi:hypothetical protein
MILTLPRAIFEPDEAVAASMLDEDERRVYDTFQAWSAYFDQRQRRQSPVQFRFVTEEQLAAERQAAETPQDQPEQSPEMQTRVAISEMISEAQANLVAFGALVEKSLSDARQEERHG